MLFIPEDSIERWIKEDVPYIDLTTLVLGIGKQQGRIQFFCRENAVVSGVEEVLRILNKFNIQVARFTPSGTLLSPGETFIEGEGDTENLHLAWKVSLNILEYCSGIATRTRRMVNAAKNINPKVSIVATRKLFPGTKELSIKAVLAGGGFPHRLGLSETILIFKQHTNFLGGVDGLCAMMDEIKVRACEKKIIAEAETIEDAVKLCRAGVDGIQFDKVPPEMLKDFVRMIKEINPAVTALAAGGINAGNVEDFAMTGVDAIVSTAVYFGKPVDMSARIIKP